MFRLSLLESGIAGGEREVLGTYDWDIRLRALGYGVGIFYGGLDADHKVFLFISLF